VSQVERVGCRLLLIALTQMEVPSTLFDTRLVVTSAGLILTCLLLAGMIIFLTAKGGRRVSVVMMVLSFSALLILALSYLAGINSKDSDAAGVLFMFSLSGIFAAVFNAHAMIAFLGKTLGQRIQLSVLYGCGSLLAIFYILFPTAFLEKPSPKIYFLNYYEAGQLFWLAPVFVAFVVAYYIYHVVLEYGRANSPGRNRARYLLFSNLSGYLLALTAIPLFYNIPLDPVWSLFSIPFFTLPLAYAIFKYELLDIRIVAKKALLYLLAVIAVGVVISLLNYANNLVMERIGGFPVWVFPFLSSIVAVVAGIFIWRKIREGDVLKYEFISIVTHKFRTPLTHIKWSTENLIAKNSISGEDREELDKIRQSNSRLVELTNILAVLSDTEERGALDYAYRKERIDFCQFVEELIDVYAPSYKEKNITVHVSGLEGVINISADAAKLRFVLETLFENSIVYTGSGGSVKVEIVKYKQKVRFSIKDNGIGISESDMGKMFGKFYRTRAASHEDTEGFGIGLYMSKNIIKRHGGLIGVTSSGVGKGSEFYFTLPIE